MSLAKIKVSELFYSLQGEGLHCGIPSVFLRTFGCNFTCEGFGMPRGEPSLERLAVDPKIHTTYNELPLVHTGCDSYASWDVRFKHLSPMLTIEAIVDRMQELLPDGKFGRDKHLIITGGEPLLGWQKQYSALINEIRNRMMGLTDITFETNGSQPLTDELAKFLNAVSSEIRVTWSISAKLPASGQKWEEAILPEIVRKYVAVNNCNAYFKFVISQPEDIADVEKAVSAYKDGGVKIPVYLMSVGGTNETYQLYERNVADFCRDNGYRFSPRLQVPLYSNQWAT